MNVFTLNEARPEPQARLEALLYLGHHGVPPHNNMVNCLRFLRLAGKEYLLAAGQVHPQQRPSKSSSLLSSQDQH